MQQLPSQQPPLVDLLDHHHPADPIAQHDEQQQQQQQSCVPSSSSTPSSTPSSPFHSPEPFSHPSSPIDNDNSLTHENLHLLDQSLALTDHGGLDDSEAVKAAAAAAVTDISTGMLTLGESYETIPTSSYVSFPSLSTSRSRANSIVSSAVMSTSTAIANNTSSGNIITSRRRRPRPWDNFHARNSDQDQPQPSEQQKHVETTPLLHSKQVKSSIHSIKTAKRGNAGGYMGRKRIMQNDDDNDDDASSFEKVEIQDASPSLEWKEGVFTDHYGSIHDGNGYANGDWKNHHGSGGTFGTPSSGMFRHYGGGATSDTCPDIPFMMIVMSLTVLQFVLMALYNIFLHYHSHRLNHQPPYAFWFSASGRIYNSGIGPNVPTLIMFGVFHPVLVMTEWWRMISGMVCCTSLIEFCFNVFWLRILMGLEEDKSHNGGGGGAGSGKRHDQHHHQHHHQRNGMALGFVFVMSSMMGALAHVIGSNGSGRDGGFIVVTGLNSAGIVGCMTAKGVMDGYWYSKFNKTATTNSQMSYIRGYDGQTRTRKFTCCGPIGFVHAAIISELLCGIFLPYTSLTSILFGALMGLCCGMLLLNQKQQQWDDSDSQSSSFVSDLEEAFSLNLNTPQRMYYDESPPPPPSSSSKGMDTPIMRRSILTSPEEDDEYDLVQSLNESGGKGLKQRNVKSAQQRKSHESNVGTVSDDYTRKHSTGYLCSEPRLRFIGLMGCLLMLSCSLAYIGLALSTPSDQVVSDSLYGCRTVHGFFQYAQDATVDVDDGGSGGSEIMTSGNFNVYEGETVCGEICIPISIYHRVMNSQNNAISFLEYGSCSQEGYKCNYSKKVFDAGFTEIEQDLYKNGECANTN